MHKKMRGSTNCEKKNRCENFVLFCTNNNRKYMSTRFRKYKKCLKHTSYEEFMIFRSFAFNRYINVYHKK